MYQLYWSPGAASMAPHAALQEIGTKFDLVKIDLDQGAQHSPDYLRLNPHERVPTLVYDDHHVMYESAAICMFLAERHPAALLAPRIGSTQRAAFLQWMAYLTNTVQEALIEWWYPDYYVKGEEALAKFKANVEERIEQMWEHLDSRIAAHGPYLCGADPFICDTYLAMLTRWSRMMPRPAMSHPNLRQMVAAVIARPAYAKMLAAEGIEQKA